MTNTSLIGDGKLALWEVLLLLPIMQVSWGGEESAMPLFIGLKKESIRFSFAIRCAPPTRSRFPGPFIFVAAIDAVTGWVSVISPT
jgi:hypothetical protein